MNTATILLPELAALLGRPGQGGERWLMREHRRLTRERGFPEKLCTGWAWPRRLVEIWIAHGAVVARAANDDKRGGPSSLPQPPQGSEEGDLVAAQRAFLHERIGAQR